MGILAAVGSPIAALVSASLWATGGIIDWIDSLGGYDGVTITATTTGPAIVWAN